MKQLATQLATQAASRLLDSDADDTIALALPRVHRADVIKHSHDARSVYGASTHSVAFASHVSVLYRGALEMLVYFNAGQSRVADGIVDAVERFGPPEIVCVDDRLRLSVAGLPDAQSLFAVERDSGRPLGVAVYARPAFHHMMIVHVGIAAEFASGGKRAHEQLLLKMLRELHRCGRRIKGVESVELVYASGRARGGHRQRLLNAALYL